MKHLSKGLIILPFAGGSSYSMKGLSNELKDIDILIYEMPGRGRRVNERLLKNIHHVVDDLYSYATEFIRNHTNYIIYGHSMGSLLGYLLIKKINESNERLPLHFYVSGRGGPAYVDEKKDRYLLPSEDFKAELIELGGCPKELLESDELMNFFEPILRADFEAVETYEYLSSEKLKIPITGFFGSEEETTMQEMKLWQKETVYPVEIIKLRGNHFFIFEHWKEIAAIILENKHISKLNK